MFTARPRPAARAGGGSNDIQRHPEIKEMTRMTSQVTQPERDPARQRPPSLAKIISVVMLGALMMQLDMTMTTIATRTLGRDFHSPLSTIQWVTTGYMLAMAATIPLAGWALE